MPWLKVITTCRPEDAERLAALLESLGSAAVLLEDAADDPLFEPWPGDMPLWRATRVSGLFPGAAAGASHESVCRLLEDLVARVRDAERGLRPPGSPAGGQSSHAWRGELVPEEDWVRKGRQGFAPRCHGGRLWLVPSWCVGTAAEPAPGAPRLVLDPGLAFGTGSHPSTALMLEALAHTPLEGREIIDYGCGSGILALAALALGAERAWAVDTDPQAIAATRENAAGNGLGERLVACPPQRLAAALPARREGGSRVLVANILTRVLLELAPVFEDLTEPGDELLLAGVLAGQEGPLLERYRETFALERRAGQEEWLLLRGERRSSPARAGTAPGPRASGAGG